MLGRRGHEHLAQGVRSLAEGGLTPGREREGVPEDDGVCPHALAEATLAEGLAREDAVAFEPRLLEEPLARRVEGPAKPRLDGHAEAHLLAIGQFGAEAAFVQRPENDLA